MVGFCKKTLMRMLCIYSEPLLQSLRPITQRKSAEYYYMCDNSTTRPAIFGFIKTFQLQARPC